MSNGEEGTLSQGLSTVTDLCDDFNINPETVDLAESIFQRATESDDVEFIGRSVVPMAASTVLIACRKTGDVRTADEIAESLPEKIQTKRIHSDLKYLSSKLSLGLVNADPNDYVDRIADELNAEQTDVKLAKDIISAAKDDGVGINRSPRSLAATAFYFVGAYDRVSGRYTQKEVADVVDVSTLTVRENYNDFASVISPQNLTQFED